MMNNTTNILTIHTDTYSKKSFDILTRIKHYMLNEANASVYQLTNFIFSDIKIESDREIVLTIPTNNMFRYSNNTIKSKIGIDYYYRSIPFFFNNSIYFRKKMDQILIRKWLLSILKKTTTTILYNTFMNNLNNPEIVLKYNRWIKKTWDRKCDLVLNDLSGKYININGIESENYDGDIIVSDVYCLYDILSNDKKLNNNYSAEQIDNIYGIKRDPILTEYEKACHVELNKLKTEFSKIHAKILVNYQRASKKAINEAQNEAIFNEYNIKIKKEKMKYKEACEQFKLPCAFD